MIAALRSERLILRAWRPEDFPAYAAFVADEARTRFIGGPKDEWQAWTAFASLSGEWVLNGYGIFAIEIIETGELAGYAGLWQPHYLDEPELAWGLFAGFEGRGIATEAVLTVREWAADTLGLPPLMSFVHPRNTRSHKLLDRLGATPMTPTTLRDEPRLRFRHISPATERRY
ncbi:GNAT family N-acetyltransferase [Oricola cellulosilytica]|uniref:N-acetyltransferase n=1 Tax=Oricola cellulosilytica TaxID=1429082 RepID=A0A4R0PGG6_9HYPH|nr:GNAT family N-acetyltransferase [Oricola cellulosilytica]TCD15944.1 N-acetyltransferase [Oricola cellulosilytica]